MATSDSTTRRPDSITSRFNCRTSHRLRVTSFGYGSCDAEGQTRANRAKDYLVNTRGIDAGRLVVVDGGCMAELKGWSFGSFFGRYNRQQPALMARSRLVRIARRNQPGAAAAAAEARNSFELPRFFVCPRN